jgi:hypothetical protein
VHAFFCPFFLSANEQKERVIRFNFPLPLQRFGCPRTQVLYYLFQMRVLFLPLLLDEMKWNAEMRWGRKGKVCKAASWRAWVVLGPFDLIRTLLLFSRIDLLRVDHIQEFSESLSFFPWITQHTETLTTSGGSSNGSGWAPAPYHPESHVNSSKFFIEILKRKRKKKEGGGGGGGGGGRRAPATQSCIRHCSQRNLFLFFLITQYIGDTHNAHKPYPRSIFEDWSANPQDWRSHHRRLAIDGNVAYHWKHKRH